MFHQIRSAYINLEYFKINEEHVDNSTHHRVTDPGIVEVELLKIQILHPVLHTANHKSMSEIVTVLS